MATIISGRRVVGLDEGRNGGGGEGVPRQIGRAPHLVVVLVGDDPASVSYVTGKAKASAEVGIRNTTIRRPAETGEAARRRHFGLHRGRQLFSADYRRHRIT